MTVGRDEELRSECVANGEAEKRLSRALKRVMGHLPLIFPERLGELLVVRYRETEDDSSGHDHVTRGEVLGG